MKRKRLDVLLETSPSTPSDGRPKRRRNDTTLMDTIQYIFDCLRNQKKDDDLYLCEAFLRVPKKRTEPQYFEVVQSPIDMLKIQQKIKTDQYNELEGFCEDIKLLIDNAKLYYAKSTEEYKDACTLWTLFEESKTKAPEEVKEKQKLKQQQVDDEEKPYIKRQRPGGGGSGGSGSSSAGGRGTSGNVKGAVLIMEEDSSPMDMKTAVKELYGAIITARDRDADNRLLSYCFRVLPSKQRYPEYYTVIENPIDLRIMAQRICNDEYEDLDAIVADFDLLFNNACIFNEPGSGIFKDAVRLRKLVHARKQDLMDVMSSGRGKLRCQRPVDGGEWHEIMKDVDENTMLPLAEQDNENIEDLLNSSSVTLAADDDDNPDDDDVDVDDIMWQLFLTAKNLTVPSNPNYHLIEPFRRLPNRRWHADYYSEIKNPISMCQIRNKIKRGEYNDLSDLHDDFNLMLNNAQQYNRPDSRIHRDAVTLQAAVQAAVNQLLQQQPDGKTSVSAATVATPQSKPAAIVRGGKVVYQHASGSGASGAESESEGEEGKLLKRRPGQMGQQLTFKRRAKLLFKTLMDYMTEDGRQPIVAFIEKPSHKEYPEYYQVIENPIDMEMIETRIKSDYYPSEKELLADFRLMLRNCRTFNEEGSVIHNDAKTLDKVLTEKVKELNSIDSPAPATPVLASNSAISAGVSLGSGANASPAQVSSVSSGTPIVAQSSKVIQLKKSKQQPPLGTMRNIKNVYNAVREYKDGDGRQISDVFMKLPSKIFYPDYYELIKQPIDLERVVYKWKTGLYSSVDDCLADLTLLFNNACRYNEPESQIYRDALTLQQIALQKRLELVWQDAKVPRVKTLVQELLMSLFITVYNHEDLGRYTAESFADLPTQDPLNKLETGVGSLTSKNKPLTFDIIKRRLDKGLYSRLDHFQEDLFSIFVRARKLSSLASRVYRDSITLQKAYMQARDKVCGSGRILKSQALKFSLADLEAEINADVENRKEEEEDEEVKDETDKEASKEEATTPDASVQHNETNYSVGDFVYVVPAEPSLPKRIIHIQRIFKDSSKGGKNTAQMISGYHYFRPEDTFHPATRKFYPKEVFKTEKTLTFPITDIVGKCLILFVTDYPKLKTDDIPEDDIYVCEARYISRSRFFKKIKVVPFNLPSSVTVTQRDVPLSMTRVDSVFKERIDKHKEELAEVDEETAVHRSPLPNVARTSTTGTGELEFEQYNLGSGAVVKLGDFVYVKMPAIAVPGADNSHVSALKAIRHVTRIWLNPQGVCCFLGSVYSTAQELYMSGVQLDRMVAYKQEVYLTSVQDSLPLTDIIGRCSVLHVKEYALSRLTEIPEKDVYLCQNFYDETSRRISPLQSGIVKFQLTRQVLQDEVYYFSTAVNLQKAVLETINLSQLPRRALPPQQHGNSSLMPLDDDLSNDLMAGEDSMDSSAAPSLSSDSTPPSAALPASPSPATLQKTPGAKKVRKPVSGYLIFSSEIRKSITMRNPSANFGEISRLVGIEWKKLSEVERKAFEDRAHIINQEAAEKALNPQPEPGTPSGPPASHEMPLPASPDVVFECMWNNCDIMFEDLADMYEHLLDDTSGHVSKVTGIFECQWRGCSRQKKNHIAPFPMLARLSRHCKEVHLLKNTGRVVQHQDRSRNFIPSSRRSLINSNGAPISGPGTPANNNVLPGFTMNKAGFQVSVLPGAAGATPPPAGGLAGLLQKQPEPLFAPTPAKTQRLLHSEAYIKYIENLDKPYQSNWERHMTATIDNTVINDSQRLPVNWLSAEYTTDVKDTKDGNKKDALQALWALRNIMMKDALCGGM